MKKILLALFVQLFILQSASAVLRIEITKGVEGAAPIAIIPFVVKGNIPVNVSDVVTSDLQRSGKFAPLEKQKLLATPTTPEQVNYKLWRVAGVDHVVIGEVSEVSPGQYDTVFRLLDVFKGKQVLGYQFRDTAKTLRSRAHEISDLIYEKITGQKGAFDTYIAYITVERKVGMQPRYKLQVADTDGYNPQTVLTSSQPIMSPSWSPDGTRLAYVSFEDKRSEIYIQNLATRQREKIALSRGINGSPAWSPDGTQLAIAMSKGSGNPDIYLLSLASRKLTQLTRNWGIDTEPAWMPDGKSLVFTSSRSGKPKIYRKSVSGGQAKRLTFEGDYNANAQISPNGESMAFVNGSGNVFRIAIMDLATGYTQVLTDGKLDESPSFAPNGSMILYATQDGQRGVLAAVSSDGRFKQKLVLSEGDVREPTWAPFKNNAH